MNNGKKKKGKKKGYYFTQETENAIIEYNSAENPIKRDRIYNEHLKYPLEKLVENVFNTFKFEYFLDDPVDVQSEVLSFILLNLHKYKGEKGRAFSYFSIVAKNYLIHHNNKNYKNLKSFQNIDESDEVLDLVDEAVNNEINDHMHEFIELMYDFWDFKIPKLFQKQRDLQIAYAVVELFRYVDSIDVFKKKTIYLYVREMTGHTGQFITPVINKMKPIQKRIYDDFLNYGKIQETRYV